MSVTTTANARTVTLRQTLAEYELHHSETNANPETGRPAPDAHAVPVATTGNPPDWDTTHRRVPPYRPIRQENLNTEGRNEYNNNIERTFVFVMLNGVGIQSVSTIYLVSELITALIWDRQSPKAGGLLARRSWVRRGSNARLAESGRCCCDGLLLLRCNTVPRDVTCRFHFPWTVSALPAPAKYEDGRMMVGAVIPGEGGVVESGGVGGIRNGHL